MAWELADNVRGPKGAKGDAGTISSVSVATLPAGEAAKAEMSGTTDVHVHFEIPRGAKGEQGVPGTLSSASAETVPADQSAEVIMSGTTEVKHAHFKLPRGLPGVNGVENDLAVATYIAAPDSQTRAGLNSAFARLVEIDARNYDSLPDAIAAVNASGGSCVLRIAPGSYETTTLAFTAPYVTVEAAGAFVKLMDGINASLVTISADAIGFTWRGGTLDGNADNQSGTSHGVEYLAYTGGLRPADRGGLAGVVIQNVLTDGIHIAVGRVQVQCSENTSVRVFGRYGVYFGGTDCTFRDGAIGLGQTCAFLNGHTNWLHRNGIYSATSEAIRVSEKGRYGTVSLNVVDNNPGGGLVIAGVAADTMDLTVTGNIFRANSQVGAGLFPDIHISQARAVMLSGNQTCAQADRVKTSYAVQLGVGVSGIHDLGNAWEPLAHVSGVINDGSKMLSQATAFSSADIKTAVRVTGDSFNRFQVTAAGLMQWGPGNAIPDTSLYRPAANILRSGHQFQAQRLVAQGTAGAGYVELETSQTAAPSAGVDGARMFVRTNVSGKRELCVRFPEGAIQVVSTEP